MARMSSQQRMERMAAEKEAAAKEQEEKKATKKKATKKKAATRKSTKATPAAPARTRIIWVVCNHTGRDVKTYTYPQKDEADAEVARLKKSTEKHHYVERRQVAME